jgi:hypothetical protein
VRWLDAALVAVAAGVTAFTLFLGAADYPAAFLARPVAIPTGRAIVLRDAAAAKSSAYVLGPKNQLRTHDALRSPGELSVSVDRADRAVLVAFLARLCRSERIPAEHIADPAGVGGTRLIADVSRAMMR